MNTLRKNINSRQDILFDIMNTALLLFSFLIVAYPLYYIIIASISNPMDVALGKMWFYPVNITFESFNRIFLHKDLWIGYKNTIFYTITGTLLNLSLTLSCGYALSRRDLIGRNIIMAMLVFTMYFHGGLIPTYLLVRDLGLYNSFWVMIIPNAVSVFNVIICRTYFQSNIPNELLEASVLDGCSDIMFFLRVVLPISKANIAVMTIFYAVGHWNAFFNGLIYLRSRERFPLQLILKEILLSSKASDELLEKNPDAIQYIMEVESMKYGVIIVSSLPVLLLYPFLQKYFIKGVMVGSIKG